MHPLSLRKTLEPKPSSLLEVIGQVLLQLRKPELDIPDIYPEDDLVGNKLIPERQGMTGLHLVQGRNVLGKLGVMLGQPSKLLLLNLDTCLDLLLEKQSLMGHIINLALLPIGICRYGIVQMTVRGLS